MIGVAVSGAAGQMGMLVADLVEQAADLQLVARYDPHHPGGGITDDSAAVGKAEVVVEFTRPDVVMANLANWRRLGVHAVVGTSGFGAERIAELVGMWGSGPPNCLVAPNFSVGAVLAMRFAELAAPHFQAAEVIELHHDRKLDAPSGTALATAERIGRAAPQSRATQANELTPGARGALVSGVPVHAVRLPGLLAHQEVVLGSLGETLTIRHDTSDRQAFGPGILLAIRQVADLPGVTIGIDKLLGV